MYRLLLAQQPRQHTRPIVTGREFFEADARARRRVCLACYRHSFISSRRWFVSLDNLRHWFFPAKPVNSAALFVPAIYLTRPVHRARENELLVGAISKPVALPRPPLWWNLRNGWSYCVRFLFCFKLPDMWNARATNRKRERKEFISLYNRGFVYLALMFYRDNQRVWNF